MQRPREGVGGCRRVYRSGARPIQSAVGGTLPAPRQPEIPMSADKDRGIRRQKQKRAKELKRQLRQQREAAAGTVPSKPQAA
jgi:hypothetical protein